LAGAGGVQAHDGQVDALERGGVRGEVSAGADGLADAGVDALDGYLELQFGSWS
jgi:hypothetical protein